eukprot:989856-Pelagomonas_calceolata.AAC.9
MQAWRTVCRHSLRKLEERVPSWALDVANACKRGALCVGAGLTTEGVRVYLIGKRQLASMGMRKHVCETRARTKTCVKHDSGFMDDQSKGELSGKVRRQQESKGVHASSAGYWQGLRKT